MVALSSSPKLSGLHLSSSAQGVCHQEHLSSLDVGSFEMVGSPKSRNKKMENWFTGARMTTSEKCGLSLRLWGHAHRFNHLESHPHSVPSNSIPSGDTWFGVLFLSKTKQKPAGLLKTAYLKIAIFHLLSAGGKGSLSIPHCSRQFANSVCGTQMSVLCSLSFHTPLTDSQTMLGLHALWCTRRRRTTKVQAWPHRRE